MSLDGAARDEQPLAGLGVGQTFAGQLGDFLICNGTCSDMCGVRTRGRTSVATDTGSGSGVMDGTSRGKTAIAQNGACVRQSTAQASAPNGMRLSFDARVIIDIAAGIVTNITYDDGVLQGAGEA